MSLPNFPLFQRLLTLAKNHDTIAIDDIRLNKGFTYLELIHAVSQLQVELLNGKK